MKILIISKSFYPMLGPRSFRATELAKSLAKLGHSVKVLTFYNIMHKEFSLNSNIEIVHFNTILFSSIGRLFLRFINKFLIYIRVSERFNFPDCLLYFTVLLNKRKIGNPDLLITITKPHSINWAVAKILKDTSNKFFYIADCGDPFYNNPFRNYSNIFRKLDSLFYKQVNKIVVPVESSIISYDSAYKSKVIVIPQGFDICNDLKFRSNYIKNDNLIRFAYAGNFYKNKRDPKALIEYLKTYNKPFLFYIFTNSKLVYEYVSKNDSRFVISNFVERSVLIDKLSQLDFLISINNIDGVQSPSKLIDYAICGRPILSLPNNQINSDLFKFLDRDYTNKLSIDLDMYNITSVASKFLALKDE